MKRVISLSALAIATSLSAGVQAATSNEWRMTAASSVEASQTKSGIAISANVELQNTCYEASIIKFNSTAPPQQYQVVTRVKPEDVGKMCAMVVVPGIAHGSFIIMHNVPTMVTVRATNKVFTVPVKP